MRTTSLSSVAKGRERRCAVGLKAGWNEEDSSSMRRRRESWTSRKRVLSSLGSGWHGGNRETTGTTHTANPARKAAASCGRRSGNTEARDERSIFCRLIRILKDPASQRPATTDRLQEWLPRKDSNLDKVIQSHLCYHYTTRHLFHLISNDLRKSCTCFLHNRPFFNEASVRFFVQVHIDKCTALRFRSTFFAVSGSPSDSAESHFCAGRSCT